MNIIKLNVMELFSKYRAYVSGLVFIILILFWFFNFFKSDGELVEQQKKFRLKLKIFPTPKTRIPIFGRLEKMKLISYQV